MTYYDAYCNLYDCADTIYFCDADLLELLGINNISCDDNQALIFLIDKSIESGFNEGFKFAMKIFFNNL